MVNPKIFRYVYFYTLEAHADIDWSLASCYIFELSLETTPQVGMIRMIIMMMITNLHC